MNPKPTEILADGLDRMGLAIDSEAVDRLARYFQELKKWNSTYNLVAKAPDQELIEKHFLDSLTLLPLLKDWEFPSPLLDIGTGAGFPGLVLKVAMHDLKVTLLEPRLKRVAFLKHIVRTLGLPGVTILAARLEPDGRLTYAATDQASTPTTLPPHPVITSRAFTQIAPFLELAAPVCLPNGRVICMKGAKAETEIAQWQGSGASTPFQLAETRSLHLAFSGDDRTLLVLHQTSIIC